MTILVACLAMVPAQYGFDWTTTGEGGPLKDFSMTANFSSRGMKFEGPIPENPDITLGKTGTVFARVNVEFYVEQYGKGQEVWSNTCGNICQGPPPPHKTHKECDRFCDAPCETTHKFETLAHSGFSGWGLPQVSAPFTEAFAKAAALFRKRNMPVDENLDWLTNIRDTYISQANEKAEKEMYVYEPKHVGREPYQPCLWGKFTVFANPERVMANIMTDLVFQETRNGELVTVYEMPMGEDVQIPVTQAGEAISGPTVETSVQCLCGGEETALMEDQPAMMLGNAWKTFPLSDPGAGYQTLVRNMKWGDAQVTAQGESMTACTFNISGDPMAQLYVPAGTLLVPDNNRDQVMMTVESYNSSLIAGIGSFQKQVRTACTQMGKDEPTSKTKFAIAASSDGNLNRLAQYTVNSRFRGAWDQVRIWTYTEGATYDEIAKKLSPMVAKPVYLLELDRVLKGGISAAKRKKLNANISLEMISDFRCGVGGLNRALPVLWAKDSKKLMSAVPEYAANWIKESETFGPELVANLTHFLGTKKQPEPRAVARAILAKVPAEMRKQVTELGGLESVAVGAFSADKAEVKATVELLKLFGGSMYAETIAFGEGRLN